MLTRFNSRPNHPFWVSYVEGYALALHLKSEPGSSLQWQGVLHVLKSLGTEVLQPDGDPGK